ncbi:hypothetical protein [uncultured Roseobacter sp.]|uniref:hypothetical protein n=1 Tax=uncultured Roseobacter sp. TaxID=114847 RepID=UPI002622DC0B|nr:hypothetical protein [uncultured Roseobacter sp.]
MSDTSVDPVRGLLEDAKTDRSWGPRLKALAEALSDGDRSALIALLQNDAQKDAAVMTSRGSANDRFWAHLSNVGLTALQDGSVPEPLRETAVAYKLTPEGRRLLPPLVGSLFRS